ncbi:MAG: hypothetical protein KGJ81_00550 [Alphaproteobacteria bacterium]|nr:hypothetical protein [Alphaproteobacteria bacterium]
MTILPVSAWRRLGAAFALSLMPLAAAAGPAPAPGLVIAYHTRPANWLAFRSALKSDLLPRLEALRKAGALRDFHLLLARDVDAEGWNATALLDFAGAEGRARWDAATAEAPAGLTPQDLALTSAIDSTPVTLARGAAAERKPDHPVFLVIPYRVAVSDEAYLKYLDGYTLPQLKGWIGAGILSRYAIYMGEYPAGRPWTAMLVLEYADELALGERDRVKAQVRETLARNPAWKAISDDKSNIRSELSAVVASEAGAK